ncbi:MAG: hypothetical protein ABGW76_11655 [Mesonia sp.]|uniref:hypothetical protein n=1 Tax=Mesonia sp. TaxID=1960830 RepID=UPI003242BEC2
MKKIQILAITLIAVIGFLSCEGDRGPQGPPGVDGIIGTTEEYTNINLNYDDQTGLYTALLNLPYDILDSDAILVYRLENTDNSGNPIWAQLPHNFFLSDGNIIQYVFNHTFYDFEVLIDANFDPALFTDQEYNQFTRNQTFRVVIVPSVFANDPNNNLETYQDLLNEVHNQGYEIEQMK